MPRNFRRQPRARRRAVALVLVWQVWTRRGLSLMHPVAMPQPRLAAYLEWRPSVASVTQMLISDPGNG